MVPAKYFSEIPIVKSMTPTVTASNVLLGFISTKAHANLLVPFVKITIKLLDFAQNVTQATSTIKANV
jgi:hypothetical protein